jgi:glycosyltransferase involved in cell wall biosynthesis
LTSVDRVVVLARWVGDVLRANGVPDDRLVRAPHGVAHAARTARSAWDARYIRVAHLGRLDARKGTRLLIAALLAIPDAPVTLDVFGITQNDADRRQLEEVRALTAGDGRIRFLPPLDHAAITTHLAAFDAVAVPSQLLETGPLVVLEAFAAGVPVIGSALGGIAEHVRHGVDGWLVDPHHSVEAWRDVFERCVDEPRFLSALREGIVPPRSIGDAAAEMRGLYATVIAEHATRMAAPHVSSLGVARGRR